MKHLIVILIAVFLINTACNKSDNEPTGVEKEVSWIIGADLMGDAQLEVPPSTTGKAFIEISEYSICASEVLQITVSSDQGTLLLNRQEDANIIYELETPPESEFLIIQTSLVPHRIDINCVTAGSATITYRYVN
ncbi:MAG: hypothetical protein HKN87_13080 [Saprospiraceae bacterium]|nr:hypothetical protein [Saprospiraceae bacterium]